MQGQAIHKLLPYEKEGLSEKGMVVVLVYVGYNVHLHLHDVLSILHNFIALYMLYHKNTMYC